MIVQQCQLNWDKIDEISAHLSTTIGRNDIHNDSSIFSQNHCPFSHISLSRVGDNDGNKFNLFRQSKSYGIVPRPTKPTNATSNKIKTTSISREEGIFFIGYQKDTQNIIKMLKSQLGSPDQAEFQDKLLTLFKAVGGNILYVPSQTEITGEVLKMLKKSGENKSNNANISRW